jgi:hypothetical protein
MSRFVWPPNIQHGDICDLDEDNCGAKGRGVMPTGGAILLGEVAQNLATIHITCNFCPPSRKGQRRPPYAEHGPDMPIPDLLRLMSADCPRRLAARIAEPCGVHLPDLSEIFVKKPAG